MNEPMTWKRGHSNWYVKSDEGYHVAKVLSKGVPAYQAFSPTREKLGKFVSTADEAKEICEAHWEVS